MFINILKFYGEFICKILVQDQLWVNQIIFDVEMMHSLNQKKENTTLLMQRGNAFF
jgi:hypothetical protein